MAQNFNVWANANGYPQVWQTGDSGAVRVALAAYDAYLLADAASTNLAIAYTRQVKRAAATFDQVYSAVTRATAFQPDTVQQADVQALRALLNKLARVIDANAVDETGVLPSRS